MVNFLNCLSLGQSANVMSLLLKFKYTFVGIMTKLTLLPEIGILYRNAIELHETVKQVVLG